jgi:hypothetical protein
MGFLNWLEKKLFFGEIIRDYGELQTQTVGMTRVRTSVLLCRRQNKLLLAFRNVATARLSASANYVRVEVTPSSLSRLEEILKDVSLQLSIHAR